MFIFFITSVRHQVQIWRSASNLKQVREFYPTFQQLHGQIHCLQQFRISIFEVRTRQSAPSSGSHIERLLSHSRWLVAGFFVEDAADGCSQICHTHASEELLRNRLNGLIKRLCWLSASFTCHVYTLEGFQRNDAHRGQKTDCFKEITRYNDGQLVIVIYTLRKSPHSRVIQKTKHWTPIKSKTAYWNMSQFSYTVKKKNKKEIQMPQDGLTRKRTWKCNSTLWSAGVLVLLVMIITTVQ